MISCAELQYLVKPSSNSVGQIPISLMMYKVIGFVEAIMGLADVDKWID